MLLTSAALIAGCQKPKIPPSPEVVEAVGIMEQMMVKMPPELKAELLAGEWKLKETQGYRSFTLKAKGPCHEFNFTGKAAR